jgi:putative sporulation protein YtaF
VIALCTDAFAAALTYGISKIKIPVLSAVIISFIGTAFLCVSLFFAGLLSRFISSEACMAVSAMLLFFIGTVSIFQNTIKSYLKKHKGKANVSFSLFSISFAVDIFIDEKTADADNSKILSSKEAIMLAVALSVDSVASGFSAGLLLENYLLTIILCFFICMLSVFLGGLIGRRISKAISLNLGWLSGAVLITIAMIKLMLS